MLTVHHLYWPRRWYQNPVERRFRSLPWNIVHMPEDAHTLLHRYAAPPRKPSFMEMLRQIAVWEEEQERQQRLERQSQLRQFAMRRRQTYARSTGRRSA